MTVHYETQIPPPGAMTISALTQPFEIVSMPRTGDNDKPVRFVAHEVEAAVANTAPSKVTYMLTLARGEAEGEGAEPRAAADVVAEVKALSGVRSVKHLKALSMCIVEVDSRAADDLAAVEASLRAVEGVKDVARDA